LELEKAELKDIVTKEKNPAREIIKDETELNELKEVNT
jgi:hypothetical protein